MISSTNGGTDGDLNGAAAFAATLQFVDDWDATDGLPVLDETADLSGDAQSDPAAINSGSDDSAAQRSCPDEDPSALTEQPQRQGRRRPADELRELRRQEFELSTRLEALRLDARRQLAQIRGQSDVVSQTGFWQRAASRQFEYRKRVEGENARLRVLVKAQIRKARCLRQLFLKRIQSEYGTQSSGSLVNDDTRPSVPADNDEVFARLLATIDADYLAAIETLESKRGQLSTNASHESGSIVVNEKLHGDNDVLLEYFADTTVPFAPHTVGNAVWLAFAQRKNRQNPSFQREFVEVSDNLIKSSAHLEIKSPAFHLLVQVRIIARKYVEQSRTVVVLKTFVEPRGASDGKLIGMLCYETSVRVLTPVDAVHATTRMETYATLRRKVIDGPNAWFWRHAFNVSIAKMVWNKTQLARNEVVESLLVDEAMRNH